MPTDKLGEDGASIAAAYNGEARATALAAGWFSVVLLGRVLFAVGVRKAFRDSGRDSALLDFAVAAMAISVAIEVLSFSLAASAAWLSNNGVAQAAIVALDAASSISFVMVAGPIGASILAAAIAIVDTRLLARWIGWLGVAAGGLLIVGGILAAAALGDDGAFGDWGQAPEAIGVPVFWLWMLAVGIVLWRSRPRAVVHETPSLPKP